MRDPIMLNFGFLLVLAIMVYVIGTDLAWRLRSRRVRKPPPLGNASPRGSVYVFLDGMIVKVGMTRRKVIDRRAEVSRAGGKRLVTLMSINRMPFLECVEKTAHNKLSHSRVHRGVEWFSAKYGADHVKQAVIESALEVRERALAEGKWNPEWDTGRTPDGRYPIEIYEWEGRNTERPLIVERHLRQERNALRA